MIPCHQRPKGRLSALLSAAAALALAASSAHAVTEFDVTNLVSDGFVPAAHIDPLLQNPWGVSFAPMSPFWVSDNQHGVTTLYNGAGQSITALPKVTIPPDGSSPTGQVFNNTNSFQIDGKKPFFIFDGEDGHISGWTGGSTAATLAVTSTDGAVYKGLALASDASGDHLYASDFHGGVIEDYTNTFGAPTTFTDTTVDPGYAPFNVQVLGGKLYVTFALQDAAKHDDVAGPGNGYVDVFNLDGTFDHRVVGLGGEINSPWGLAIAPSSFREFAGDLLVGNFGDGTISAFDGTTFEGKLLGRDGNPLHFGDLWALTPGNGFAAGDTQKIYFTAGLEDEAHGLFGALSVAPEPWSWTLMLVGFGLTGAGLRARRRTAPA
jgi:uncharacterized protein (TIGR03118 family)